jgi:hypothetical protein
MRVAPVYNGENVPHNTEKEEPEGKVVLVFTWRVSREKQNCSILISSGIHYQGGTSFK